MRLQLGNQLRLGILQTIPGNRPRIQRRAQQRGQRLHGKAILGRSVQPRHLQGNAGKIPRCVQMRKAHFGRALGVLRDEQIIVCRLRARPAKHAPAVAQHVFQPVGGQGGARVIGHGIAMIIRHVSQFDPRAIQHVHDLARGRDARARIGLGGFLPQRIAV